jgi:hypothetical protein
MVVMFGGGGSVWRVCGDWVKVGRKNGGKKGFPRDKLTPKKLHNRKAHKKGNDRLITGLNELM